MGNNSSNHPPKWADRFLEFYCNPTLLEQIQGDVHELYYWRLEEKGIVKAKNAFWWDVIRFFRWRNIKRSTTQKQQFNNIAMLKNYFKIGWRNLLNQKIPSFINIFGLAIAIACCMVAYLFIEGVWMKGMLHENKSVIYMVTHTAEDEDGISQYGYLAPPLAKMIEDQYSTVDRVVRVNNDNLIVKYKNENFYKFVQFVDSGYMNMFTHEIVLGDKNALKDPYQVLLTENTAQVFFGGDYPIGKELQLYLNDELITFTVGAVVKDHAQVAMFHFEILINNYHYVKAGYPLDENWKEASWTFLQINKEDNVTKTLAQMDGLLSSQHTMLPDRKYLGIQLEPFMQLARKAQRIKGGAANGPNLAPQIVLAAIGILLLMLAIFNYINIAILMAAKRIKEIGIRKVIGSNRRQLAIQFLSENLITCFLAIVVGLAIADLLFIPWFNDMATTNLHINLINNPNIYIFLLGLLLFITLASGAYPAFYISSFKPLQIFAGKQKIGGKGRFTSVLLTLQFVLAVITIIAGISFLRTNEINQERDWGYDNSSKIVFNTPTPEVYNEMRNELLQQNSVLSIAGNVDRIGRHRAYEEVKLGEKLIEVNMIRGSLGYPETFDLRLTQGRFFDQNLTSDIEKSVLVNERFLKVYDLEYPVNTQLTIDSTNYSIVGIIEDFHYTNFRFDIDPTIILATPDSLAQYMTVKVAPGETQAMADFIKKSWHQKVDDNLYQGVIQAEILDFYFEEMRGLRNTFLFTATFAILLSSMGLFGLVSLNIRAKMKDYSIKKVLGASMAHLSKTVLKKYVLLWIIGCILGSILATRAITGLLDSIYTFHAGVGFIPIISAIALLLTVIIVTISTQLVKVKNSNPVDNLRTE